MMKPGLGTSLTRAATVLQTLTVLMMVALLLTAFQTLMSGAPPTIVMNYFLMGISLPIPLWFLGLCGKVLADMHGYFYWAQEKAMAKEWRPAATP